MAWMAIVTAVMSVLQSVSQSKSEAYNASVAKVQGKQEMANAVAESDRQRRINQEKMSQGIAAAGAQGTSMEGSPMTAFLENARQSEVQAQDLLFSGRLKKSAYDRESELWKRQSENTLWGGIIGAGTKLFGSMGGGASSGGSLLTSGGSSGGGFSSVGSGGGGGVWSPSNYTLR